MISQLYSTVTEAKNNSLIPVLKNGKTLESRYNPDREAETFVNSIDLSKSYYIITGISSGHVINKLNEINPDAIVICIERTEIDIEFLLQLPIVKQLKQTKNIFFAVPETLEETILNTYLPAKYGDIKIIERKTWLQENEDIIPIITQKINKAIGIVSADYSVQAHFGKIWQKNIINNLKILSKIGYPKDLCFDNSKHAYVVAAGPSLDKSIMKIKQCSKPFIISTDTAYGTLLKNSIIPDIVISIDGQNISTNHFINNNFYNTLFLFDLCSNSSIAQNILEHNGNILYFISGHPFCNLINYYLHNKLLHLFSGSGTVTITAVDFAISAGFKKITVLGADFGYCNNKAYTKGTYFDSLYNLETNKTFTNENNFNHLLFRTELISNDTKKTTSVLKAYEQSFKDYLIKKNVFYSYEDFCYELENTNLESLKINNAEPFNYKDFWDFIKKANINDLETPLLPFIAYLRNHSDEQNFVKLLQLAYSNILSYN